MIENFPYTQGITWKASQFKSLGITFCLNLGLIFDLNYKEKLKRIEQTLKCWRMRNLSLIGKICVIKSLVLPQLLYLFSVLCIKIPTSFFKELNKAFYTFIWNGGKDRVQRKLMCNDYHYCGLRMIDAQIFALAQKMTWVKCLVDKKYSSMWKTIELTFLENFHTDSDILWKSYAPERILKSLNNTQLAESLRTWYSFREEASLVYFDHKFSDIGGCQLLWFNKLLRSKSKQFFYYDTWYAKNICTISDLLNPPLPGHKLFEELVLDFEISNTDRRKYNFLVKNIPPKWLEVENPINQNNIAVINTLVDKLVNTKKVPSYAYNILIDKCVPDTRYLYWCNKVSVPQDINWENIHVTNFMCTIDTRLRAFYFKVFHKTIALNGFLHKIKRKDSPNCTFCNKVEETMVHLFCECEKITPIWNSLLNSIHQKHDQNFNLTNFKKLFGISSDKFLTYLFLVVKYYIHLCKFKNVNPNFIAFKAFTKTQKESEYNLAKKRGKLSAHFKKWKFDL